MTVGSYFNDFYPIVLETWPWKIRIHFLIKDNPSFMFCVDLIFISLSLQMYISIGPSLDWKVPEERGC